MNTIDRELTEAQLYENQGLGEEMDRRPLSPKEYMRLIAAIKRSIGSGNIFNGSTKMISWLLGINALLIAAAISGGISFALKSSERFAALETKMEIVMLRLK